MTTWLGTTLVFAVGFLFGWASCRAWWSSTINGKDR